MIEQKPGMEIRQPLWRPALVLVVAALFWFAIAKVAFGQFGPIPEPDPPRQVVPWTQLADPPGDAVVDVDGDGAPECTMNATTGALTGGCAGGAGFDNILHFFQEADGLNTFATGDHLGKTGQINIGPISAEDVRYNYAVNAGAVVQEICCTVDFNNGIAAGDSWVFESFIDGVGDTPEVTLDGGTLVVGENICSVVTPTTLAAAGNVGIRMQAATDIGGLAVGDRIQCSLRVTDPL